MRLFGCFHSSGFGWFHFSSVVVVLVVVVVIVWLVSLFLCSLVSLFLPRSTVDFEPKLSLSDFPLCPSLPPFSASFNPSSGPTQRAVCWHLVMAISSSRKVLSSKVSKMLYYPKSHRLRTWQEPHSFPQERSCHSDIQSFHHRPSLIFGTEELTKIRLYMIMYIYWCWQILLMCNQSNQHCATTLTTQLPPWYC